MFDIFEIKYSLLAASSKFNLVRHQFLETANQKIDIICKKAEGLEFSNDISYS